jgi:hypothetical protein
VDYVHFIGQGAAFVNTEGLAASGIDICRKKNLKAGLFKSDVHAAPPGKKAYAENALSIHYVTTMIKSNQNA